MWEYYVAQVTHISLVTQLNKLGLQRWELVTIVDGYLVLKRLIVEESDV